MALTQVQGGMLAGSTNTTTTIQSNGTTAITVNSSQNVGIGTTSPSARLHVTQSGNPIAQFTRSDSGTGLIIASDSDGPYFRPETSSAIRFNNSANTVENMRISSGGDLLVGTTTVSGKTSVKQTASSNVLYLDNSNATTAYGMQIAYTGRVPNSTGEEFIYTGDSSPRFVVRSNGGIANYSANNVNLSDEREKTNIQLAGSYLDKICAIPVKTFNYIDQNRETDDGLTLGVIAQDVQKVAPELVMESNWAGKDEPEKMRLGIYQTDLQYALMKAIQELKAELDATKEEVAALKAAP